MKVYLRILENNDFGFMVEGVNENIMDSDIEIEPEDYMAFFENVNIGKHYRLVNPLPGDGGLFDYLEEYTPEEEPLPLTDLQQTQLALAEAIEKQETDKVEQQLAQAEMFETILQMLEPQGGGE